jgi:hypothetical protein
MKLSVFKLTYSWFDEISNPYIVSQHYYNAVILAKDVKAAHELLRKHISDTGWIPTDGDITGTIVNDEIPTVIEIGYLVEQRI